MPDSQVSVIFSVQSTDSYKEEAAVLFPLFCSFLSDPGD